MDDDLIEFEHDEGAESVEVIMQMASDMVNDGFDIDDVIGSMLCAVSVLLEHRGDFNVKH